MDQRQACFNKAYCSAGPAASLAEASRAEANSDLRFALLAASIVSANRSSTLRSSTRCSDSLGTATRRIVTRRGFQQREQQVDRLPAGGGHLPQLSGKLAVAAGIDHQKGAAGHLGRGRPGGRRGIGQQQGHVDRKRGERVIVSRPSINNASRSGPKSRTEATRSPTRNSSVRSSVFRPAAHGGEELVQLRPQCSQAFDLFAIVVRPRVPGGDVELQLRGTSIIAPPAPRRRGSSRARRPRLRPTPAPDAWLVQRQRDREPAAPWQWLVALERAFLRRTLLRRTRWPRTLSPRAVLTFAPRSSPGPGLSGAVGEGSIRGGGCCFRRRRIGGGFCATSRGGESAGAAMFRATMFGAAAGRGGGVANRTGKMEIARRRKRRWPEWNRP